MKTCLYDRSRPWYIYRQGRAPQNYSMIPLRGWDQHISGGNMSGYSSKVEALISLEGYAQAHPSMVDKYTYYIENQNTGERYRADIQPVKSNASVSVSRKLPYRYKSESNRWTDTERFEREATEKEIEDLRQKGYTVTRHRRKL